MNATQKLHGLGQSLWLDNITRNLLPAGHLNDFGARPQRLLWASTGAKNPTASDILYIEALAAPFTVNTMLEGTVEAFADQGKSGTILTRDEWTGEDIVMQFRKTGNDIDSLAAQLQDDVTKSFVKS